MTYDKSIIGLAQHIANTQMVGDDRASFQNALDEFQQKASMLSLTEPNQSAELRAFTKSMLTLMANTLAIGQKHKIADSEIDAALDDLFQERGITATPPYIPKRLKGD